MSRFLTFASAVTLMICAPPAFAQTAAKFSSHVIVGNSTTACSTAIKGAMQFNTAANALEVCDGTTWLSVDTVRTGNWILLYDAALTTNGQFSDGSRGQVDSVCQNNKPAELSCSSTIHTFVSLNSDPIASFPSTYGIPSGLPVYWYNRTSKAASSKAANNWAGLISGTILASYAGGTGSTNSFWTGSTSTGGANGNNCQNFSYSQQNFLGEIGSPTGTDGTFLDQSGQGCAQGYALICVCVQN